MPIDPIVLQQRYAEVGRIRTGKRAKTGKKAPIALDVFRLTSRHKRHLERAAELWGGTVAKWGTEWELETEMSRLPVVIPPQTVSQWFELYGNGFLVRRCDGITETLSGIDCVCADLDERECKPKTRLNVMLADLPDIGTWLYTSSGYNVAAEMPQTVDFLNKAGGYTSAQLVIEQKERRVIVNGKPLTKKFNVTRIEITHGLHEILERINTVKALEESGVKPALGMGALHASEVLQQEPSTQMGFTLVTAMGREGHWKMKDPQEYVERASRYIFEKGFGELTPDETEELWVKLWTVAETKLVEEGSIVETDIGSDAL